MVKNFPMKVATSNQKTLLRRLKAAEDKYRKLGEALAALGPIRRGSIYQTRLRCGSAGCSCQRDPDARHGPYWLWTAKVGGKTKCRKLNADSLPLYRQQSKNYKKLKQIIQNMELISNEITECQLELATLDAR